MKPKIDTVRALTAVTAKRIIATATTIGLVVFGLIFIAIWALAHFLTGWWWLLLLIYIPCLVIALILRAVAKSITRKIYPQQLSSAQEKLLTDFADKVQHVVESGSMSWEIYVFLSAKDLLLHRELRTMKELIVSTASLKNDFAELERNFS